MGADAVVGYANQSDQTNGANPTSPTVNLVTGGSVGRDLYVYNGSTVNVTGGSEGDVILAYNSSTVNITGGTISGLDALNSGTINVSGGSIIGNGDTQGGTLNISGGVFSSALEPGLSGGMTNISGGTFNGVNILGGNLMVTGGTFGGFNGNPINFLDQTQGSVIFLGTGLKIVTTSRDSFSGGTDYTLAGTLEDGSSVNGDVVNVSPYNVPLFTLVNVAPEPSPLAALGIGVLGLGILVRRACKRTT